MHHLKKVMPSVAISFSSGEVKEWKEVSPETEETPMCRIAEHQNKWSEMIIIMIMFDAVPV